jgi:hypothetical protein
VIASKLRTPFLLRVKVAGDVKSWSGQRRFRVKNSTEHLFPSRTGRSWVSNKDGNEQITGDRRVARQSEDD